MPSFWKKNKIAKVRCPKPGFHSCWEPPVDLKRSENQCAQCLKKTTLQMTQSEVAR